MDSGTSRSSIVEQISYKTKRSLSIETALTTANVANCNPQTQSPLFSILPQELRDLIWEYASTQDEDRERQYPETAFHYRPGYTAPLRTSTAHLLTCRLAWLEANALAVRQTHELSVWLLRGPHDLKPTPRNWQTAEHHEVARHHHTLGRMTANGLRNVTKMHLFLQMFELERLTSNEALRDNILRPPRFAQSLNPKLIHVTVRQSDWWYWEQGEPPRMGEDHIQAFLDSSQMASVSRFNLELETDDSKKGQLDELVERLRRLQGSSNPAPGDDNDTPKSTTFVCDTPPRYWQWSRSPRLDNKDWSLFEGKSELQLYVAELTWRNLCPTTPRPSPNFVPDSHIAPPRQQNMALVTLADARNSIRRNQFVRGSAFELGLWRLAMHRRHQVAELSPYQWKGLGLENQVPLVWFDSVDLANRQLENSRERFEQWMGDFEARRLVREWEIKGSLLRFEDLEGLE